jgi:hypothetical protein
MTDQTPRRPRPLRSGPISPGATRVTVGGLPLDTSAGNGTPDPFAETRMSARRRVGEAAIAVVLLAIALAVLAILAGLAWRGIVWAWAL